MQIEPQATAFAKRYARGEAQVVWTTLVSDLETPVSAFLKIAAARPLSFLLESVEGGAVRGRYSIIGLDPDLIWRTVSGQAEINRTAQRRADGFTPCNRAPLAALRALIAESRVELPDVLPPMAAGIFGYLGYDMVRLMEELPQPNPDPIGIPDAVLMRPTIVVVFDSVKDAITVVTPVRPESGTAHGVAVLQYDARRIRAHGECCQGVHRRRRHFPGCAVATFRGAVRIAALCALPGAAAGQPGPLSLFPRLWGLLDRRLEPGNPGASTRGHGDGSAARRHAAARHDGTTGPGARIRAAGG